jgi:hypothetical protein
MKKYLLVLFVGFGFINKLKAQNLVLNPSFEILRDTCYPFGNGISDSACIHWDSPTMQTPDYMNICANGLIQGVMGVPINWGGGGFQYPKDGNAYAGYFHISGGLREYIQGTIQDSLIIGKKYKCYYYVSLQSMQFVATNAGNNFGMGFTTYHVKQDSTWSNITNFQPKINDTTVISDTLNWVKVEGTFIADSAYKFFTIGNFFDEFHTKGLVSYYYLDDVHIEEVKNDGLEEVKNNGISVYPNPADKLVTIQLSNITDLLFVNIYNSIGVLQQSIQNKLSDDKLTLDVSNYPEGVYLMQAIDKNKSQFKIKISVNH